MRYIILMAMLFTAGPASAHSFLDHAAPLVGETVTTPPKEVTLFFTAALEPGLCQLRVEDSAGGEVDLGHAIVDESDSHILRAALKPLAPGTYHVTWRVIATDTHATNGGFAFTIAP